MPLTPEDVANKQFTSTRLKPGYDETEVDEFLDEVEAELTRLYRENDDFRSQLASGGGAAAPAASPAPAAVPAVDPAVARENEELRAKLAAAQRQLAEASQRAATAQQVAPPAPAAQPPAPAAAPQQGGSASEGATGILALAQRTADEHIAEARTQADRIVGEARSRAEQLKRETEERHRQAVGSFEAERTSLERKVEELRNFEREYRSRLKSYLEAQLQELEGHGTEAPAGSRPGGQPPQSGGGQGGGGGHGGGGGQGGGGGTGSPGAAGPAQQAPQARGPFSPGSPVGGNEPSAPSGPPQQPSSGIQVDDGSGQQH